MRVKPATALRHACIKLTACKSVKDLVIVTQGSYVVTAVHSLLSVSVVQVWPERRGGITWKTVVTYCCTSDYCNTKEALQELIDGMDPSDLPPNFVTSETTPSDGVITADGTVSAPPFTIPSSSSSEQPATSTASSSSSSSSSSDTPVYAMVVIAVLSLTVVIIVAVIVVILTLHFLPQRFSHSVKGSGSSIVSVSFPVDSSSYSDPSLNELLEDSGSGSGLPLLIQRSISGQITLHNLIGKGRFGEVWRGIYKGDQVAVKIFHTREELSWFHEVEVYQTCLLRHPNVLRFIAADNRDVGLQMQLWLISDYCELGSLFDLLSRETFSQATALKLCHTAASGINHLHTEIVGAQCKPAIAHRDLKSRNILVKSDYSCCIADLGLSLTYKQATGVVKTPPRTTVGTRRYLAPEVLTESITIKNFESFKRSDIYSFGLVMWEIGRRAECDGHAEEAQLPYFDLIPSDPTLEEVQRVVVQERRRPSLPNPWNQHEVMAGLSRIIQQCWLHEAQARLTSLRIKKSLANLREFFRDTKEPGQP
jgi:TGF-beta receptor type-1